MSPAPQQGKSARRGGRFARLAAGIVLVAAAFVAAVAGHAEIYKWTDDDGSVHFTDEPAMIPERHRSKASVLVREAPSVVGGAPAPGEPPAPASAEAAETPEDPIREAERLRAKIAAKEELVRAVDEKTSLATNPLRNRIVDPADQELYRKYQAELPGDRERLKALDARIESLK